MMAPRNSWRYKMTVEVETPEGVRSGSAVREVRYQAASSWFPLGESRPQWRLKGEAVAVDLPNGRILFALLRGNGGGDVDYGARIADRALGNGGRISGWPGPVELWPTAPSRIALEQTDTIPMMVTFADSHNAKSVEQLDPANLASTFGAGVRLRRITVEVVNDQVTMAIQKKLKWLSAYPETRLDANYRGSTNPSVSEKLSHGDFRQGTEQ